MWWQPEIFAQKRASLKTRQQIIKAIRNYFMDDGFDEVETPALQTSPGNEVHLQAFRTELRDPHGGAPRTLYLHTSPEFAMKKLLVAGMERIFQFAHAYRNGEISSRHHPEFLMLEWYRAGGNLDSLRQDCMEMVRASALVANKKTLRFKGMECDVFAEWENLTVPEAFLRYCAIDILATAPDPMNPSRDLLASQAKRIDVRVGEGDSWDDIFHRIMGERIEPFLGKTRPCFLCDYPISMAALARPKSDDPRLAERMELYICGLELANGFDELTNADEQEKRFKADMDMKEKLYGERYPIDMDFIRALHHGMPASAGIAFGIDRLVMLCCDKESIDDVVWCGGGFNKGGANEW